MTYFSHGNTKLPKSTAIFNMTPASNGAKGDNLGMLCPEYLAGTCQLDCPEKQCYAIKAERQYAETRAKRQRQANFWANGSVDDFVARFRLEARHDTDTLRFNESGGIADIHDIIRLGSIARALPDITIYVYTSRSDLWDQGAFDCLPDNVSVVGSGFMAHNAFMAGEVHKVNCPGDCRACHICLNRHGVTMGARIH